MATSSEMATSSRMAIKKQPLKSRNGYFIKKWSLHQKMATSSKNNVV